MSGDFCPQCGKVLVFDAVIDIGWLFICTYGHRTILLDSQLTETLV